MASTPKKITEDNLKEFSDWTKEDCRKAIKWREYLLDKYSQNSKAIVSIIKGELGEIKKKLAS
jgi:hypothetical protein